MARTVTIALGVVMIGIGWYREAKYDKKLFRYMKEDEERLGGKRHENLA